MTPNIIPESETGSKFPPLFKARSTHFLEFSAPACLFRSAFSDAGTSGWSRIVSLSACAAFALAAGVTATGAITGGSFTTTGTTTTNDLVTKGPWVDVRAYASSGTNCVNGDGTFNHTSTADWGPAINAAYAALGTTGRLTLSGGDYYFATKIGPFTGQQRVYDFSGSRLIWNGSTTGPAVQFGVTGTGSQYNSVYGLNVRTLVVDLDKLILFQAWNHAAVYSLIANSATTGETVGQLVTVDGCILVDFFHPETVGGYDHFSVENNGSSGSNSLTFYGISCEGTGHAGVRFKSPETSYGVRFIGGTIESMEYGVLVEYPNSGIIIDGVYFEANGSQITVSTALDGVKGMAIRDCRFKYNGNPISEGKVAHIELAGVVTALITGNLWSGGSTEEVPLVHMNYADAKATLIGNTPGTAGTAAVVQTLGHAVTQRIQTDGVLRYYSDGAAWPLEIGNVNPVRVPVADRGYENILKFTTVVVSGVVQKGGAGTTFVATTTTNHEALYNMDVTISGTTNFNGVVTVTAIPTPTTFEFVHANDTDADETGLTAQVITGGYRDITFAEEFPEPPAVNMNFVTAGTTRDGPLTMTDPTETGVRIYNHSTITSLVLWTAIYLP